jgi:hypothetical protein
LLDQVLNITAIAVPEKRPPLKPGKRAVLWIAPPAPTSPGT